MNIFRSSLKLFSARLFSAISTFIGIALFANELGADKLGIFFLFQGSLGILTVFSDFGIGWGVEKRISEGSDKNDIFTTGLILKLLLLTVVSIIIWFSKSQINSYLNAKLSFLLIISLFASEISDYYIKVLNGELRVGETAKIIFLQQLSWVVLGYLLIVLDFGVKSLIYSLIISSAIGIILGLSLSTICFSRVSLTQIKSILDFSRYAFVSVIGGRVYSWVDLLVIGYFLSSSVVSAYEIAWRISGIVMLVSSSLTTSSFPIMSNWDQNSFTTRIEQLIPKLILISCYITIPAFVGASLLSVDILGLIFGEEYTFAWVVLIIFMAEKIIQSIHIIIARALQAIDHPDLSAQAAVVSILLNIVLNILLVSKYGMIGAAFATSISFFFNALLHLYYLNNFIKITAPVRQIFISLVSSGIMGVLILFMKTFVEKMTIISLFFIITSSVIIYGLTTLPSNSLRRKISSIIHLGE